MKVNRCCACPLYYRDGTKIPFIECFQCGTRWVYDKGTDAWYRDESVPATKDGGKTYQYCYTCGSLLYMDANGNNILCSCKK